MREQSESYRPYWMVLGLIVFVTAGVLWFNSFVATSDHAHSHSMLAFISQILFILSAGLCVSLYFALRRAKQHSHGITAEKEKSEQLAAKLASHKAGIDAHAIVSITDAKGTITYVNDKFCKISKYEREELIGQNHRILNSGTHPSSLFSNLYRTIDRGETWSGDICNKAKDGTLYWVSTTVMAIRNASGKIEEMISIRTDISAIKRKEEELLRSNQILHTTFENYPGAISAYDNDLVLQIANPAFYQLLGIPAETYPIGSNLADMFRYNAQRGEYGPGDIEKQVADRIDLAKEFQAHSFERRTPEGLVLDVKGWPLKTGGFVSSHVDVTEHHRMIEDLQSKNEESKRYAEALQVAQKAQVKTHEHLLNSINSMSNGFAIWDHDLNLLMANDAFRQFHSKIADEIKPGISLEQLLNRGCDAEVWKLDGQDRTNWINQCIAEHRDARDIEHEVTLSDGTQWVVIKRQMKTGEAISTLINVTAHRERETELRRTRDALEHIAYFDALTTLPNRAHCEQDLEMLMQPEKEPETFALMQIDLDKFKRVNDTMGHAAGDHLLKEMGSRLAFLSNNMPQFQPYRWGGDEFIAIIKSGNSLEIEDLCQELTDLVAVPVTYNDTTIWPTASLGVAVCPGDASDLESLMIYADLALYKTKEKGRDGYHFFSAEMKQKIDKEIEIETDVRQALEQDQFELYFQPQISTVDESITGVEALLRWNHPERGQLPPGLFMDVVERFGLASPLGRRIFDKAMAAVQSWTDSGLDFGRLSINLSPEHLKKNTLIDDFNESMSKYAINPDLLAVELLESVLVDDRDSNVHELFEKLARRGVHVELDDFGTGYASLAHLSNLPVDGVKIDRSFVNEIENDTKKRAIVEVVMSMSRLMKLRVVCEGIETHDELSTVSQISNCSIQGYLVSRPLNFTDMTSWISEKRNVGKLSTPQMRLTSKQV